jgi:hypothetical protein
LLAPVYTSIPPYVEASFTDVPLLAGWTGAAITMLFVGSHIHNIKKAPLRGE